MSVYTSYCRSKTLILPGLVFCFFGCVIVFEVIWLGSWAELRDSSCGWRGEGEDGEERVKMESDREKGWRRENEGTIIRLSVLSQKKKGSELVNTERSGTGHKSLPAPKPMFVCDAEVDKQSYSLNVSVSGLDWLFCLNFGTFPFQDDASQTRTDRTREYCVFSLSTPSLTLPRPFSVCSVLVLKFLSKTQLISP